MNENQRIKYESVAFVLAVLGTGAAMDDITAVLADYIAKED